MISGLFFQFALGIFCIRTKMGRSIFECIGQKVAVFFDYSKNGAMFVYGNDLVDGMKVFAFTVSNNN